MMDFIVMGAALFAGAFIEDMIPVWPAMGRAELPLVLSIVIYYALSRSSRLMFCAAVLGGILNDGLDALPLGASILCFCVAGVIVRYYRNVVFSGKWMTHMFFGAAAGLGHTIMLFFLMVLMHPDFYGAPVSWVVAKMAGCGILGALATPITVRILQNLDSMMGNIAMVSADEN